MKKKDMFKGKTVVIALIIFLAAYALISFKPFGMARLHEITGGPSILDMEMSGYSVDKAYQVLEALGAEGRAFDLNAIIPLDFPFPLAYSFFYFFTLAFLTKTLFPQMKKPWLPGLLGFLAGLFDWLENIMIIVMLKNYPTRLENFASLSNIFTTLKSLLTMVCMGLILIGLIVLAAKRLVRKPVESNPIDN
ncbi:MAG: hypothetical protein N2376_05805 [Clostridia bacterium]|nr:hypothetical protein [Clostridia bacterium]